MTISIKSHAIVPITNNSKTPEGVSGELSLTISYESEDQKKKELEFKISTLINIRHKNDIVSIMLKKEEKERYDIKTEDNFFLHGRYIILDFYNFYNIESFVQYERNYFHDLSSRRLIGVGLGKNSRKIKGEFGSFEMYFFGGGMYEDEESISDSALDDHGLRGALSTRMTISSASKKNVFYINAYLQPKISNFNDYRIIALTGIESLMFDSFTLGIAYEYKYDSKPFEGVVNLEENLNTYISYRF